MAFCSFSSEQIINNSINIDNTFINEFLPTSPDYAIKVYLYGLYLCNNANNNSNTLSDFARVLNMEEVDVVSAFYYWKDLGVVHIISLDNIEVKYLPIKYSSKHLKKYNVDKYKDFNITMQELISGRMITPNEYNEYYYLMESMHIEEDALIGIVNYCISLKGNDVGYKYIITVAKNWAYQGITSYTLVKQHIDEQQASQSDMKLVLAELKIKRVPTIEDYELYVDWTKNLGFELDTILKLAKTTKSKFKGGVSKLDSMLNKFYSLKLISFKEIEQYLMQEDYYYDTARAVCKNIGVRYDDLEAVVKNYVLVWFSLGFDHDTLNEVSTYCFKANIRTLEGVNKVINKFYNLGAISIISINEHINQNIVLDKKIESILEELGILRQVNNYDRSYYNTWIYTWQTSEEVLNYAISISKDKIQPMNFLNKVLSIYFYKKIKTLEEAKNENISFTENNFVKNTKSNSNEKKIKNHEYTKEELNSMFTSFDEVVL